MSIWDTYKRASGMSAINSFLHPEDAYKAAGERADQGYNEAQGYQQPYMQHGNDQYDPLNQARTSLMNPADLENQWASGYETSPYAKDEMARNQTAGLEGASSMGLMGSSAALNNIQQGSGQIMNKDRQQYMDDMMKKYMAGIGLGEDIYGAGASAAGNMGNRAMEHGNDVAGLQYKQIAAPGQMFAGLLGQGAELGANYATGGGYGIAKGMGSNSMNNFNQG